ncbi:hypothetical protein CesoFtcFv8_016573 [Champsocephalus esox]|uniref:Uncharacterized protein n=1 Tax=Champsocephalus esox TaxID=159716 RepID=A0AAN8BMY8_9TELE|nr:hypothetical protein CesoFtcFv8_016573 [Champsocephalus esox]
MPNPAVYKFDKSGFVSILSVRRAGKVSHLRGSSDIQSGLQRGPARHSESPSHPQTIRGIKETELCEMWFF